MTVLFLPIPGASFDFASLSFHVPICGLAAKQAAAAINERAAANTAIRVFIMRRFRQKYSQPSITILARRTGTRRLKILPANHTNHAKSHSCSKYNLINSRQFACFAGVLRKIYGSGCQVWKNIDAKFNSGLDDTMK